MQTPQTLQGFLEWLYTTGGLSAATTFIVGGVIAALAGLVHHDLTNNQKRAVGFITPFVVVLGVYALQNALHYVVFNIDTLWSGLILAWVIGSAAQALYQGAKFVSDLRAAP